MPNLRHNPYTEQCVMCRRPWCEGGYCPDCYDLMQCRRCHRLADEPDGLCAGCEEVEAIEACPLCHGSTDDPGNLCPACWEIDAAERGAEEENDA